VNFWRPFKIAALLGGIVWLTTSCSDQQDANAELKSLRKRIDIMEQLLIQQSTNQAAEKQLMIRALESSTQRLDALVQTMGGGEVTTPVSKPPLRTPANPKERASQASPATTPKVVEPTLPPTSQAGESLWRQLDVPRMIVIFLAVALLLLVTIVVFFPGKLSSTVPTIEFSAEESSQDSDKPDTDPAPSELDAVRAHGPEIVPLNRRFPDPVVADGAPVAHQLSLGIKDQDSLEHWVSVLDSYLNTEPYILRNPAPRVSVEQDQLLLQFYALPNLSKTEHALLDATVKRLQPSESPREASDPVWKQGWGPASAGGSESPAGGSQDDSAQS
jgi:hypothetical protein